MDKLGERLARIETGQEHHSKQLDRMLALLDRMVKVEEHVEGHTKECALVTSRLAAVEAELATWKSVRVFFAWFSGLTGAIVALYIAWKSGRI